MELSLQSLNYSVSTTGGGDPLRILNGISAVARRNSVLAILGPSGSGKTTLLNVLSGRVAGGVVEGEVLLNGQPLPPMRIWKRTVGYVLQQDKLLTSATVGEVLRFSSRLRNPQSTSVEEHEQRVGKVLAALGLEEKEDFRIGLPGQGGLSGGELRRASIGQELVADVKMLFLDEPTSGLDSTTAFQIMELLTRIAHEECTVVATIHQPQQKITSLFDQALLLAKGKVCFYGEWKDSSEYFQGLGFRCPQYTNPSDYFMDIMTDDGNMRKLHEASGGSKALKIEIEGMAFEQAPESISVASTGGSSLDVNDKWITSLWFQTKLLVVRGYRSNFRNELFFWSELSQYLFFGLFFGALYFDVPNDVVAGTFDRLSAIFFNFTIICFTPSFTVVTLTDEEKPLLKRETEGGYYRLISAFVAKIITTWPFEMLFSFLYMTIFYFMIGFQVDASKFFLQYLILLVFQLTSETIGYMCAYSTANSTIGVIVLSMALIFCLSLSGFLVSEPRSFLAWFEKINYFTYAYTASALVEFQGLMLHNGNVTVDGGEFLQSSGRLRNDLSLEANVVILISFLVLLRAACIPLLYLRMKRG